MCTGIFGILLRGIQPKLSGIYESAGLFLEIGRFIPLSPGVLPESHITIRGTRFPSDHRDTSPRPRSPSQRYLIPLFLPGRDDKGTWFPCHSLNLSRLSTQHRLARGKFWDLLEQDGITPFDLGARRTR